MEIRIESDPGRPEAGIISLEGELDASNFTELIATGQSLIEKGVRYLLLDLSQLRFMSSSGLVALHSLARIYRGEAPYDSEAGWATLRAMGEAVSGGLDEHIKLIHPQERILQTLQKTGMDRVFEIFPDSQAALASLPEG
jgi:anti-anti-sigma regulatory factor